MHCRPLWEYSFLCGVFIRNEVFVFEVSQMKPKSTEFENFDKTMRGLLAVPYSELQKKLEEEKQAKHRKKKRATSPASSRVSVARKKRVA